MATENSNGHSWNDPLSADPRDPNWQHWTGSVLLSDEIHYYCTQGGKPLIEPFDARYLKPARYQLTLGREALVGGEEKVLDEHTPLVIPPHQVAIVRTHETLTIPRFLIGRWNLRVEMVYKGLLWVGALQVDPGWVGYLPCPLYNLSDKPITLGFRSKLFTIDFVRTTPFGPKCISFPYPDQQWEKPINPPIGYYDRQVLRSGPYEALRDLQALTDFRNTVNGLIPIILTALGVMATALGVLVARPTAEITSVGSSLFWFWPTTAIAVALAALSLSLYSFFYTRSHLGK